MLIKQILKLTTFFIVLLLECSIGQISNLEINGDFRYRHEHFNQENVDVFNRHQIRARLMVTANIASDVLLMVQIASGEGNAPFSTDQTLGDAFTSKNLWLDKAYVSWKPHYLDGLQVVGGKAPNPIYRPNNNQLEWNPDVHMEGLSLSYNLESNDFGLFATAFSYWMEQRAGGDDSWLIGSQIGFHYSMSNFKFTTGIGYHTYVNAIGNSSYFDPKNSFGNTVNADGTYMYGYDLGEIFLELSAHNLTVYTSAILNTSINDGNLAYIVGLAYEIANWTFSYDYRQIEKDALIGVLNDPDFADGVTNSKGHKANIAYGITNNIVADLTYIHSIIGIGSGEYYRRLQLAINFNF